MRWDESRKLFSWQINTYHAVFLKFATVWQLTYNCRLICCTIINLCHQIKSSQRRRVDCGIKQCTDSRKKHGDNDMTQPIVLTYQGWFVLLSTEWNVIGLPNWTACSRRTAVHRLVHYELWKATMSTINRTIAWPRKRRHSMYMTYLVWRHDPVVDEMGFIWNERQRLECQELIPAELILQVETNVYTSLFLNWNVKITSHVTFENKKLSCRRETARCH